jgi:DNA-binding LacI/PurR family transcriptional regulator
LLLLLAARHERRRQCSIPVTVMCASAKQRISACWKSLRNWGYRRNEFARAMSIGQSHVIGFLTSERTSDTVSRILQGALDEATAQGYVTKILRLPYDGSPREIIEEVSARVQLCSTWRLDGVVALGLREGYRLLH